MRFAEIPGLEETKRNLVQSVTKDKIPHAQLFMGREGSGNLTMALAYATYIHCTDPLETDSCGKCPSCSKMDKLVHPDMHMVFPVSSTVKITGKDVISANFLSEWRSFVLEHPYGILSDWNNYYGAENKQGNISKEESRQIIKNLSLKAFEGKYKIMLIWLPEWMHPSAANAILKILEEPPGGTVFLLVSHHVDMLLPTILSRVQNVNIRPFLDDEVRNQLTEKWDIPTNKVEGVIQLAQGSLREAKKLLDNLEDDNHQMFQEWMRLCFKKDFTSMVDWSEQYQKMSKVAQKNFLQYGLNMMRETLMAHVGSKELGRLQGRELDFVEKFKLVLSQSKIDQMTGAMNETFYHIERNASPKIALLDLSLFISRTLKQAT